MRRLLVLGGGSFVGRALTGEAVARGWAVTCVTRGFRPVDPRAVHHLLDRSIASARALASAGRSCDAVVDTWSGDARAVEVSTRALAGSVHGYCYVSTRSVYASWPEDADESAPTVAGDGPGEDDYPARKRRAELAVLSHFPGTHVVLRPGVVLGPRENLGRGAWWRDVMRDDPVRVLPGPPAAPVQVIDVRDVAAFALDRLERSDSGVFDLGAPPVTLEELDRTFAELTGSSATTLWADPVRLHDLGYRPWDAFPLWVPPSHATFGFFGARCRRARRHGLATRPLRETVAACLAADPAAVAAGEEVRRWAPDRRARARLTAGFAGGGR